MRQSLQTIHDSVRAAIVAPITRLLPPWVTPTGLTLLRLFLTLPLAIALMEHAWPVAIGLYGFAALTDALDGELARQRGLISTFGMRLDPTVDKVLHGIIFLAFLPREPMLLSIVIALDIMLFLVGMIRVYREGAGARISANTYGKWKFAVQAIGVLFLFLNVMLPAPALQKTLQGLLVIAIVFAFLSFVGYSTGWRKTASRVNP